MKSWWYHAALVCFYWKTFILCSDCRHEVQNFVFALTGLLQNSIFAVTISNCVQNMLLTVFFFLCFLFQVMMVSSWFVGLVTRESLNPKPYSFGKTLEIPGILGVRHQNFLRCPGTGSIALHSPLLLIFLCVCVYKDKDESLNVSNSRWPSTIASTNLLWPRGRDLSACWLQTDTWKENVVREASAWWQHRPKTHQVRLWSPPCSCCPSPKPFKFFGGFEANLSPVCVPHTVSPPSEFV